MIDGMKLLPQWFLYRLEWDDTKKKFKKHPCSLDGQAWPVGAATVMTTHAAATGALARLGTQSYALGFWLTEHDPYFLFDLDSVIIDGVPTHHAQQMLALFPGAYMDVTSSHRGYHVIGRYSGELPPHRNKTPKTLGLDYEFYVEDRGIAFGVNAIGNAEVDCTAGIVAMLPNYFPPRPVSEGGATRRPEWRGPEDDEVLIARFLGATQGGLARASGKVSLRQLWAGDAEKNNESDMALAAHLAWWTGCDGPRMERLMLRSGLVRPKWATRRRDTTYLGVTIEAACAGTDKVYQEPQRDLGPMRQALGIVLDSTGAFVGGSAPAPLITHSDPGRQVEQFVMDINMAGTYDEIMSGIIPRIAEANVPSAYVERLVGTLNKKLDFFDAKMPVAKLRALLCPPRMLAIGDAPEWAMQHCYIRKNDVFYNVLTGSEMSKEGFIATYSRCMPVKQNGERECPAKWSRNHWNIVTVDDKVYRPDQPIYFNHGGVEYVNTFVPISIPVRVAVGEAGPAIQAFVNHAFALCGGRHDVFWKLIKWMAHNVQFPGVKIRWSPLIKGVPGDGKSIFGDVLRAALGYRNVNTTDISTITNSGGFTDWATGAAVNVIEEIHLTGKDRHKLFNAMKQFIGDTVININRKGRASSGAIINVTNHFATTNFNDALPVNDLDRRWMVIFSPYDTIDDACSALGLTLDELIGMFKMIGSAARQWPGQFREWLFSIDVSDFNPDDRAPLTEEKASMAATSEDPVDELVRDVIAKGGVGIHADCFSSGAVQARIKMMHLAGSISEPPKTSAWSHTLSRLGYRKISTPVWWNGSTHRVWIRAKISQDQIKILLDGTLTSHLTSS